MMMMPRLTAGSAGRVLEARPATVEDLADIGPRRAQITQIRDRHHAIARLAAQGWTARQIADALGIDVSGLRHMLKDPAMEELIVEFHTELDAGVLQAMDEQTRTITQVRGMAWHLIHDRLSDAMNGVGPELPLGFLSNIAGDTSDRTGYTRRTENVNINIDTASTLTRAIARSAKADEYRHKGLTIELSSPALVSKVAEQRPSLTPQAQNSAVPQAPGSGPAPVNGWRRRA
jgi:hypothetical protein